MSQPDPDPAGVENEVDVVNFEASLAEQLKQLVDDLSKAPAVVENGTAPAEATGDVDEWTDADDLGYVRVPGRAHKPLLRSSLHFVGRFFSV